MNQTVDPKSKGFKRPMQLVLLCLAVGALVEINLPGSITNAFAHISGITINVAPIDTMSPEDQERVQGVINRQKQLHEEMEIE